MVGEALAITVNADDAAPIIDLVAGSSDPDGDALSASGLTLI